MIAITIIAAIFVLDADASGYGNLVGKLPVQTVKKLAEANAPNNAGAIGRNKRAYFHVRFQRGMHHVADFGLVTKQSKVIGRFLDAAEYSLDFQLPSGEFKLVIPEALRERGQPSIADRASGVAFFASSLGLGIVALETNDWFSESAECAAYRQRLARMKPKLKATLNYLFRHQAYLETADQFAPNRLLFDALAFETLGKILDDDNAMDVAASFVAKAVQQVHEQEGYFIEGGGFDSSYNAVATALALRLWMIGHRGADLKSICTNAVRWQKERVMGSGEVSTEGNTRVRPGNSGESFLGREKDVDVGHVVEALMLASQVLSDPASNELALKIVGFYESKRARSR